jgi:hypothetical protein
MNEDLINSLLLSKQLKQKRIDKQKWKRRVLSTARRGFLDTTCSNNLSSTSSNTSNKYVEDNSKVLDVYQYLNDELNIDSNECDGTNKLNVGVSEHDELNELSVDVYEYDEFNTFDFNAFESGAFGDFNVNECLFENSIDIIDLNLYLTQSDVKLHNFTDINRTEYCKKLLLFLRDAKISKTHTNRLIQLIHAALPSPNNLPKSMKQLLTEMQGNCKMKNNLVSNENQNFCSYKRIIREMFSPHSAFSFGRRIDKIEIFFEIEIKILFLISDQ